MTYEAKPYVVFFVQVTVRPQKWVSERAYWSRVGVKHRGTVKVYHSKSNFFGLTEIMKIGSKNKISEPPTLTTRIVFRVHVRSK